MKKSRLAYQERKRVIRTIFTSFILVIGLIAAIIYFGIPLLVKMAAFMAVLKPSTQFVQTNEKIVIPIPALNALPEATFSSQIKVSGYSQPNTTIELFLNGSKSIETLSRDDGSFDINLDLIDGENIVTASALDDKNNKSDLSHEYKILLDNIPPELAINSPADAEMLSGNGEKTVDIQGKTEPDASVTINNRFVIVGSDGQFTFRTQLGEGENKFIIMARDRAGNQTTKELSLRWQP